MKKYFLHILTIVMISVTAKAQNEVSFQVSQPVVFTHNGTNITPSSQSIPILEQPDLSGQRHKVLEANLYVKLQVGDKYLLGEELQSLIFDFKVDQLFSSSVISSSSTINFELGQVGSEFRAEQVYKYDFTDELINQSMDEFEINNPISVTDFNFSFNTNSGSADVAAYIHDNVKLLAWYEIKYGVDVRNPGLADLPPPSIVAKNNSVVHERVQTFIWATPYHYPSYQLQILKLENEDPNAVNQIISEVDWNEALTVHTYSSNKQITLTVAEGSGYYIWRVRGIGDYYEGEIADSRNWGTWSNSYMQGQTINLAEGSFPITENSAFYLDDPDNDLNWIYSRVFTEAGNVHEGMTYANGLLQPIQSQAYSSSDNTTIVTQSVMDYLGRPALNSLPIPIEGKTLEGYEEQFMLDDMTGELYSAKHFDDDGNIQNPGTVDQSTNSAFKYYSDNNTTDAFVPDAQGYPYSRTIFMNDGSGRPIESSGVGAVHAIGTSHTTKIYYATPSDDELIAIFGDEAPLAENVLKTSTIDPNGTVNIVYTTIEGKTIATAMTDDTPSSLQAINGPDYTLDLPDADFYTVVNTMDENKFISSTLLALHKPTQVKLSYSVGCKTISSMCAEVDGCEYYIIFRVINEETGEYYESNPFDLTTCDTPIDFTGVNLNYYKSDPNLLDLTTQTSSLGGNHLLIDFNDGYWKVQKIVGSKVDPENIQMQSPVAALGPLMELVSGWMANVTNALQHSQFLSDLNDLKADLDAAHASATGCGDYTTPCYQAYFDQIRADYGFDASYLFNPDFTLDLPQDGNSETYISFSTSCCGNLEVDIPSIPVHEVCDDINDKINSETLSPSDITFTQIFKEFFDELIEEGALDPLTDFSLHWDEVFPGYDNLVETSGTYTSDMETMTYHMLTDQYYVGKGYENVNNDWVTWETRNEPVGNQVLIYPNGDIPSGADEKLYGPHYQCNEVYNCWLAAMRAYYEMLSLKGQSFDVYDAVNQDESNSGQGDVSGDHFDNDDNKPQDGGFMQWLVDWIISQKMDDFSNELADSTTTNPDPAGPFAYQLNVPDLFLQCTGKKIAAIVTPDYVNEMNYEITSSNATNSNTSVNEDYDVTDNIFVEAPVYAIDAGGVEISPQYLTYPFIVKPIWAFKYYEYWPGITWDDPNDQFVEADYSGNSNYNELLDGLPSMEIATCFNEIPDVSWEFCYDPPCEGNHHNWSAEERLDYYNKIKFSKEENFDPGSVDPQDEPDCPTQTELDDMLNAKFQAAKDSCSERYAEFRAGIQNMLEYNCYEIEVCHTGADNVVTEAELDLMASTTVTECIAYVDDLQTICIDDLVYPTCTTYVCQMWTGTAFVPSYELSIQLWDPNSNIQDKLLSVTHGVFYPAMENVDSKCTTPPNEPDWINNNNECDDPPTAIMVSGQ